MLRLAVPNAYIIWTTTGDNLVLDKSCARVDRMAAVHGEARDKELFTMLESMSSSCAVTGKTLEQTP